MTTIQNSRYKRCHFGAYFCGMLKHSENCQIPYWCVCVCVCVCVILCAHPCRTLSSRCVLLFTTGGRGGVVNCSKHPSPKQSSGNHSIKVHTMLLPCTVKPHTKLPVHTLDHYNPAITHYNYAFLCLQVGVLPRSRAATATCL